MPGFIEVVGPQLPIGFTAREHVKGIDHHCMGQLGEGRPQDLVTLAGFARALFAGTFRAAWRHGELNPEAFAGRMRPDQRKEQRGD